MHKLTLSCQGSLPPLMFGTWESLEFPVPLVTIDQRLLQ